MTKKYFENVKYIQDVRRELVENLNKLNNKNFVKAFTEAYNTHISDQTGEHGAYNKKVKVTAEQYLEIAQFVKKLTEIKIGRAKIHLGISFKLGGINIHGDTYVIRKLLSDAKFRWNRGTHEWYNAFREMVALPDVPTVIDTDVKTKATKTEKKNQDNAVAKAKKTKKAGKKTDTKKAATKKDIKKTVAKAEKKPAEKSTVTELLKNFDAKKAVVAARKNKRIAKAG